MLVEEKRIDIIVKVIKIPKESKLGEVNGLRQATIDFCEVGTEGDVQWLSFGGVCMKAEEVSRNKVKYREVNITENDGRESKFFVTHELEPMNSVGHVKFRQEGDVLRYDARARNTKTHPDIVQQIKDKLVDVSVDYRYKNVIARESDNKEIQYLVEGTEIRGLCAVGVGGIASNSIEYAIAEKWQDYDKIKKLAEEKELKDETDKVEIKNKQEVFLVEATQELLDKIKQEKESVELAMKSIEAEKAKMESELAQFKQEKENQIKEKKNSTIKSILGANKVLKESELVDKSQTELDIIFNYEQKMKEKEGAGKDSDFGKSVVEDYGTENDNDKPFYDAENVIIERETGDIKLSKAGLKKFNDELLHSIYR